MSLRDVERAMLVFTYFLKKMNLFCDAKERIEKAASGKQTLSSPVS